MECPSSCAKEDKDKVYGSNVYSDFTNLCASAYHSKVTNERGGRFKLFVGDPLTKYLSLDMNGINSHET